MKNFAATIFAVLSLLFVTNESKAQSAHSWGLSFQSHSFKASAEKSEAKLSYHFTPHKAISLQANLGYGTYGNKLYSDGFLHLEQTASIGFESQIRPLFQITNGLRFVPEPYINIGYSFGYLSQNKPEAPISFETMNLGLGLSIPMGPYLSLFSSIEEQKGYGAKPLIDKNYFVRIGMSYSFHLKEQKRIRQEYDTLSEEFMNSVKSKEQVEEQKEILAQDKELMEGSYEAMLLKAQEREIVLNAALKKSKEQNEVVRNDNFELQLQALKEEIDRVKKLNALSIRLASYALTHNWGNPMLNELDSTKTYYYLDQNPSAEVLSSLRDMYLMSYENVYAMQAENGIFILVLELDLVGENLNFELQHLKTRFPELFRLVGNDS